MQGITLEACKAKNERLVRIGCDVACQILRTAPSASIFIPLVAGWEIGSRYLSGRSITALPFRGSIGGFATDGLLFTHRDGTNELFFAGTAQDVMGPVCVNERAADRIFTITRPMMIGNAVTSLHEAIDRRNFWTPNAQALRDHDLQLHFENDPTFVGTIVVTRLQAKLVAFFRGTCQADDLCPVPADSDE